MSTNVSTAIDHTWSHPGTVRKLAGLVIDLRDKLTGGGQNQRGRKRLALAKATSRGRRVGRAALEGLRKNREQETTSLARTGLCASHEISPAHDNGDRVFLYRRRTDVARKLDVGDEMVIERRVREGQHWIRDIMAASLDGDVIVVCKVDTGSGLCRVIRSAKQFTFDLGILGTRDMLTVSPLSIS